jgi:hypothetical protein
MSKSISMHALRGVREFMRHIRREISVNANSHSWSQYGEDQQIARCFTEREVFYVDIGCSLPRDGGVSASTQILV